MKIGLSKASGSPNYARYEEWLRAVDPLITCVDLSLVSNQQAVKLLESCSALVLTGGPDIHPSRYGKASELSRCYTDEDRDDLEFALYARAREMTMPILAICRGAQLVNVAEGGTLIVDIAADTQVHQTHTQIDDQDSEHALHVEPGSLLMKITGEIDGVVNSAHHQAIERLGNGLCVSAFSDDGIKEAIEWNDATGKSFLLGVQWHPERMNFVNPFSRMLAQHFIFEAESFQMLLR
ncbi:MAG: gamma-glutamyl-gamma-aminobutyrate hydrolase family protein [Bacteroidota bacterium]|nr:gamma-glutamyl-gamma-aminobutyrate hydrolase family protein [Candidatus Kapabacteria bacterium]MDW8218982.1 gamma-glutamyl-gamma-aminobutyrate hydrolase family protein [Bacteroidota bacterium]